MLGADRELFDMRKPRPHLLSMSVLGCALSVSACGGDGSAQDSGPADTQADGSSGTAETESGGETETQPRVSYYEHVRPLLAEHCVACHTDDSIAPFRLDDYASASAVAPLIKAVVEARTMPPFGVRADGSCRDWADPRWLSDEEIATIGAWIDDGVIAGDDTIAAPPAPELPSLAGQGLERVAIPEYRPQGSPEAGFDIDDYQCFLIEFDGDEDRYLTGFDVFPDNDAIVHHVLGFRVDPSFLGNGETLAELEASSAEPGWDCYGAAGEGVLPQGVPVTWAPGQGAVNYPEGVGVKFSPGDVMVVQIHYNLLDAEGTDATELDLQWADEVEEEGFQILWDPFLFGSFSGPGETLQAGMPSVEYAWQATFSEMLAFDGLSFDSIDVLGLIPHMHSLGRKMSIEIDRGDAMECAADVDRYDYNWQRTYFYEQPLTVSTQDKLDVVCDFDTRQATDPVAAGFGTQDEMCLVGVFFTAN